MIKLALPRLLVGTAPLPLFPVKRSTKREKERERVRHCRAQKSRLVNFDPARRPGMQEERRDKNPSDDPPTTALAPLRCSGSARLVSQFFSAACMYERGIYFHPATRRPRYSCSNRAPAVPVSAPNLGPGRRILIGPRNGPALGDCAIHAVTIDPGYYTLTG